MQTSLLAQATLEREIGRGASSIVYKVDYQGQSYALKLHRSTLPAEEANKQYRREAALHAGLKHPAIPAILEVGMLEGTPYLLCELVDGPSLSARLRDQLLTQAEALAMARTLASALAVAHNQGILHRDLKPDNILLSSLGTFHLIDFGLAGIQRNQSDHDLAVGTFIYAPPEQLGLAAWPLDARSDLYALGAVLFCALTGRSPFIASNITELLQQHSTCIPPRADALCHEIRPALASIIEKLLAKNPEDRYKSAEALLFDLDQIDTLDATPGAPLGQYPGSPLHKTLVGRDKELAWLNKNYRGRRNPVLIVGGAGSGKATTIKAFLQNVPELTPVLQGKCYEGDPVPLAPIRQAIQGYVAALKEQPPQVYEERCAELRQMAGNTAELLGVLGPELAMVLGVSETGSTERDAGELFYQALASFIKGVTSKGGALWIEDIHWIDAASQEALVVLASQLQSHPLQMIFSARPQGLEGIRAAFAPWSLHERTLGDLGADCMLALVSRALGGELEDGAALSLVGHAQGNPMLAWQLIEFLKEEGLLVPAWGKWSVDARIAQTALPQGLLGVLQERVRKLSGKTQEVLAVAGLMGDPIVPDALFVVGGWGSFAVVREAIAEAQQAHLIETRATIGLHFVHDHVREALNRVPLDRARTHRRAADFLLRQESPPVYRLAWHMRQGYQDIDPVQTSEICLEAACAAMQDHAPIQALDMLGSVVESTLAPRLQVKYHRVKGEASFAASFTDQAIHSFTAALDRTSDPLERARLRGLIARVRVFSLASATASKDIEAACQELGFTLPSVTHTDPIVLQSALLGLLDDTLAEFSDPHRPPPSLHAEDTRLYETQIDLCDMGFLAGYYSRNPLFSLQCGVIGLRAAHLLGTSAHAGRGFATLAFLMGGLGKSELAQSYVKRALDICAHLQKPAAVAAIKNTAALALHLSGAVDAALRLQQDVMRSYGGWMGPIEFQNCCLDLHWNQQIRGYTEEELVTARASISRLSTREGIFHAGYLCLSQSAAMCALATLGRTQEALELAESVCDYEAIIPPTQMLPWISVAGFRLGTLLAMGILDERFEQIVSAHRAWNVPPEGDAHHGKHFYIFHAYGRLELYRQTPADQKKDAFARLKKAHADLSATARIPTLQAHERVIAANIRAIEGDNNGAMRILDDAARTSREHDNPWVLFEVAQTRARILWSEGKRVWALRAARYAWGLAEEYGWAPRQRRLEREFGLASPTSGNPQVSTPLTRSSPGSQRQLEAIRSLAQASARILEPQQLARVVLDECIRALGAERACLFLAEGDNLNFACGRDCNGQDLGLPTNVTRSLLEKARTTREAVVLSVGEGGQVSSTASVVAYGLRSVLVAPLLAGDAIFGVIYLDNRLIRGIFGAEHTALVTVLGHHITSAIQTARSAELARQLQAESTLRQVSERLRGLTARLTETLDDSHTSAVLADALAQELKSDVLVVLSNEGGERVPTALRGPPALTDRLCAAVQFQDMVAWSSHPPEGIARMLTIPLATKDLLGGVGVGWTEQVELPPSTLDMAMTIASQAAIALENARLFRRVRDLAERDGLTGLFNRREFFNRAAHFFMLPKEASFAAIMFDIDHFKRVNDTYGHSLGDEVIKLVGRVAATSLRADDVIGRYGGEEFAVLLPGTNAADAQGVAERIRQRVAESVIETNGLGTLKVTISLGISLRTPEDDIKSLLSRADAALYASKQGGRNRVSVSPGSTGFFV